MGEHYDFSGWVTRNDLRCSDGRTIRRNAFKDNDGKRVPLVWNHQHNSVDNILGHCDLVNKPEGVYGYASFNDSEQGVTAKNMVLHGDINALSIYANKLKQNGGDVLHGEIKEVSLVLAGANPGAVIDNIMSHGELSDSEAIIYTDESIELYHADEGNDKGEDEGDDKGKDDGNETVQDVFNTLSEKQKKVVYFMIGQALENAKKGEVKHADTDDDEDETVEDVFNTLSEKQKKVVYFMIGKALEDKGNKSEEDEEVKHNVFDNEMNNDTVLLHAEDLAPVFADAKRIGSLKEAVQAHMEDGVLAHAFPKNEDGTTQTYGMADVNYLFPDYKTLNNVPEFISREMDWVKVVLNGTHHTPFSRIKSIFANITENEARAKGYIKGKLKKEEVFTLLKRTTDPQTVYKKQKMDRDDIIDIVDFDVVAWIKNEMRVLLDEEIARAILIGDGRAADDDDHIQENHIRPIVSDADLYSVKVPVNVKPNATGAEKAKAFIEAAIRGRKHYKGSGNPILFTTEDLLGEMLLLEDGIGHRLYENETVLATILRVSRIVTVEVMEGFARKNSEGQVVVGELGGIIVNLSDYNVGADKGGAVNMFDDFDIDYNQQKYLIETRCSGALIKPYSALVLEFKEIAASGNTGSTGTTGQ